MPKIKETLRAIYFPLKTVKTLYRAKIDKDVRQQLQRKNKEFFAKPFDTWLDMTTPYTKGRKDICQ